MLVHATNKLIQGNQLVPRPRHTRRGDKVMAVFASKPHPRMLAYAFKVNVGPAGTYIFTVNDTPIMVRGTRKEYLESVSETGYIYSLPENGFEPVEELKNASPMEYISFNPVDLSDREPHVIDFSNALKNGLQIYFFKSLTFSEKLADEFYNQVPESYGVTDLIPLLNEYAESLNWELHQSGQDVSYIPPGQSQVCNRGEFDQPIAHLLGGESPTSSDA